VREPRRPGTRPAAAIRASTHPALTAALLATLLVAASPSPSYAQSAQGPPGGDDARAIPGDVGAGELLWRGPSGWVALPVDDLQVRVRVTGVMVHGAVTQRFHNPTGQVIDVLFVFPLPDRAAVHAMEMRIGERRIRSVVREREEARREYEAAKSEGRKAALVEQLRPNLFTTAAANLNPGESIEIVLEYVEESRYRDGGFELSVPLSFTPRASPPARTAGGADGAEAPGLPGDEFAPCVPRADLEVLLETGFPLDEVDSSSHRLSTESTGAGQLLVRPAEGEIVADRDFRLRWTPRLEAAPRAFTLVEERGDERFVLVLMIPPLPDSEAGFGLPTETLFVIDVSSSMDGPSIEQARRALLAALDRLRPEDRFNLLAFNHETAAFERRFVQAEEGALAEARDWVRGLVATGGTRIDLALMRGIELAGESRGTRAQRIVFLTDGAVGNEQQVLAAVAERLGDVRLHTLGIGQAPNSWLMRKMAESGRGLCEFISATEPAENRIDAFLARLDRPVATDLDLRWEGLEPRDVHPRTLPDLHAGEALVLSARLDATETAGSVSLSGYTRGGWIESAAPVATTAVGETGIATRWARAEVEALMDSLHEGAPPFDVRRAVVDVALDHGLVTRFTSRVAVDDRPTALGPSREVRLAAALPRGGGDERRRARLGLALALCGLLAMAGLRWTGRV
jgi:Ca-activated chloride channel family protein